MPHTPPRIQAEVVQPRRAGLRQFTCGAALGVGLLLAGATALRAEGTISDGKVKIGAIVDMSGVYSQNGGPGAVLAARMAIEDFGGKVGGKPIELVSADYQNKVDIALGTARRWFDNEQVDMLIESTDSAAALAMQNLGKDKERLTIAAGSGTSELTGKSCSPTGIHYVYDTYALASGTGRAVVQDGGKSWYFLTVDYAFGNSLERNAVQVIKSSGGEVKGSVRHPLSTQDFASFLLQAQGSGAQVLGLANSGQDTINSVKQAAEFGLTATMKLAALLIFNTDVKGIGLPIAKGMLFTTAYDWNLDDQTRAFGRRFQERFGSPPTMTQAGFYSAITNYLNAVQATGTDSAGEIVAKLKSQPINDFFARNGRLRDDGLFIHDMYLVEAKQPEESKEAWDLVKLRKTIPADEAYEPLDQSVCPLVRKKS
ncbi:ABC transporter substrate-binding protein [Methylobacterium sp. P31]